MDNCLSDVLDLGSKDRVWKKGIFFLVSRVKSKARWTQNQHLSRVLYSHAILRGTTALSRLRSMTRPKQQSMAVNAQGIWICACVGYYWTRPQNWRWREWRGSGRRRELEGRKKCNSFCGFLRPEVLVWETLIHVRTNESVFKLLFFSGKTNGPLEK